MGAGLGILWGWRYLGDDEVEVLGSAVAFLVADALEFYFGTGFVAGLYFHVKDLILDRLLSRYLIESFPLDLHFLLRALVQILQGYQQRSFDDRRLGCYGPMPPMSVRLLVSPRASATASAPTPTGELRENVFVIAHTCTTLFKELGEYTLWIAEAEPSASATRREMERSGTTTASHAAHTAYASKTARHTAERITAGTSSTRPGRWGFSAAAQEEFEAILIVDFAFLRVGEDFVGLRYLFEFLGRVGVVGILIGVVFERCFSVYFVSDVLVGRGSRENKLPVCLFQFILGGVGFDAQRIVEFCFGHHVECKKDYGEVVVCHAYE